MTGCTRGEKRPRSVTANAVHVMRFATGETEGADTNTGQNTEGRKMRGGLATGLNKALRGGWGRHGGCTGGLGLMRTAPPRPSKPNWGVLDPLMQIPLLDREMTRKRQRPWDLST